jgi:hypothetical protein
VTAVWATIIAAFLTAVAAPWVKSYIDRKRAVEEDQKADRATIATLVEHRLERVFTETDRLRAAYREDLADLRRQLAEAYERSASSDRRIALLEQEVAEWRAGIRGVVGVWVAVPAHIWEFVRANLPDLPDTPFPGERDRRPVQGGEQS